MIDFIERHAMVATLGAFLALAILTHLAPTSTQDPYREQAWSMALARVNYDIAATKAAKGKTPSCQSNSKALQVLINEWRGLQISEPRLRAFHQALGRDLASCTPAPLTDLAISQGRQRLLALDLPADDVTAILRLPQPRRLVPGRQTRPSA